MPLPVLWAFVCLFGVLVAGYLLFGLLLYLFVVCFVFNNPAAPAGVSKNGR